MDATAMAEQLQAHDCLQRRLSRPWARVVVLERLARGGGATEWYVAESRAEFDEIVRRLRPGGAVSFYFADQIPAGRLSGELRAELDRLVRATGEVIVGRRTGEGPSIDMEIISGPLELAEFLDGFPMRTEVFWGTWPGRDDDGTDAVSVVLVDADGVLRAHPH